MVEPTCEQLWNEELEEIHREVVGQWRHGVVLSVVFLREEDQTYWEACYNRSTDGESDDLREGYANIYQVEPKQVTITEYHRVPHERPTPIAAKSS